MGGVRPPYLLNAAENTVSILLFLFSVIIFLLREVRREFHHVVQKLNQTSIQPLPKFGSSPTKVSRVFFYGVVPPRAAPGPN